MKTIPSKYIELDKAAEAMSAWWDDTTWLPFVEAENCNITGPGHQDKATFAKLVTEWDQKCGTSELDWLDWSDWTADDVAHLWVVSRDDWETWHVAPQDAPGAVPVTCLLGKR